MKITDEMINIKPIASNLHWAQTRLYSYIHISYMFQLSLAIFSNMYVKQKEQKLHF